MQATLNPELWPNHRLLAGPGPGLDGYYKIYRLFLIDLGCSVQPGVDMNAIVWNV